MCAVNCVAVEPAQKRCLRLYPSWQYLLSMYCIKVSGWKRDIHRVIKNLAVTCKTNISVLEFFPRCVGWCHYFGFSCGPRAFDNILQNFSIHNEKLAAGILLVVNNILNDVEDTTHVENCVKCIGVFMKSFCSRFHSNVHLTVMLMLTWYCIIEQMSKVVINPLDLRGCYSSDIIKPLSIFHESCLDD